MPRNIEGAGVRILDGKAAARSQEIVIKNGIVEATARHGKPAPHLCVVQIGALAESNVYVAAKEKAAQRVGIKFTRLALGRSIGLGTLKTEILRLNADPLVDAVLLQLPLDAEYLGANEAAEALDLLDPTKDADGLCTLNLGRVAAGVSHSELWTSPIPATPLGVMRLLENEQIALKGKTVCIVGKSRLVGTPMALLATKAGSTVTICHKATKDLGAHTRAADVLIVAAGAKHLICEDHVTPQSIVIDVGIHRGDSGLTGDVHPAALAKVQAYSPVPGGVGPMTVAALMENVYRIWNAK